MWIAPRNVTSRPAESSPARCGRACQPHDHVPRSMMYSAIARERRCRRAGADRCRRTCRAVAGHPPDIGRDRRRVVRVRARWQVAAGLAVPEAGDLLPKPGGLPEPSARTAGRVSPGLFIPPGGCSRALARGAMVLGGQVRGMDQEARFQEALCKLAISNEGFTKDKARLTLDVAKTSTLDLKMAVLSALGGGDAIPLSSPAPRSGSQRAGRYRWLARATAPLRGSAR